jgi:hypothetical protein
LRDALNELQVELARSLDILFGELAQLLRNVKGLILRHHTLLNCISALTPEIFKPLLRHPTYA